MMMEDRREVGRPRKDEQTKCIRISLASVKTSDGATLEIFSVTTYLPSPPVVAERPAIHRAVDASQLTESSGVIDRRRIGQTRSERPKVRDIKFKRKKGRHRDRERKEIRRVIDTHLLPLTMSYSFVDFPGDDLMIINVLLMRCRIYLAALSCDLY